MRKELQYALQANLKLTDEEISVISGIPLDVNSNPKIGTSYFFYPLKGICERKYTLPAFPAAQGRALAAWNRGVTPRLPRNFPLNPAEKTTNMKIETLMK